jgi:hypothetical protein
MSRREPRNGGGVERKTTAVRQLHFSRLYQRTLIEAPLPKRMLLFAR